MLFLRIQEKKRINREKAAAARKAAADLAATRSITANSAEQPSQVGNILITKLLQDNTSASHCHSHQLGADLSCHNACLSCLLTSCLQLTQPGFCLPRGSGAEVTVMLPASGQVSSFPAKPFLLILEQKKEN